MTAHPPRRAARLLAALLPSELRDDALDDLQAMHEARATSFGEPRANRWYWTQVCAFPIRVWFAQWIGGPLAPQVVVPDRRQRREPMNAILSDARFAVRSMVRTPGFLAIALLTLALGIGANAAIFSVVRTVLLRPLPFPEPERLVTVFETRTGRNMEASLTHGNFWDLNELNRSFHAVGAISWGSMNLTGSAEPERLSVANVTVGFFRALAPTPTAGRVFTDGEDQPGGDARVAVLSNRYWRDRFGGDPALVGRAITLDGQSYRVVGILPHGTPWLDAAQVFTPLVRRPNPNRESWELTVVARLRPGVTDVGARTDLASLATRLGEQYPEVAGLGFGMNTTEDWLANEDQRRALWMLMGAVGFLLLIACVNLANMLLARSTGRARERAMRAALGATRARVVQVALTESLVLGLAGAVVGLALAFAIVRFLRSLNPGDIPRLGDTQIDGWVLLVTLGTGLFTSLATGLVPALRAPYHDLVSALRDGDRSMTGSRRSGGVRSTLVAVEVALSLILLVGAGLLVRSFGRIIGENRGFDSSNRIFATVGFPDSRDSVQEARNAQVMLQFLDRVRGMPQVTSAAAIHLRPLIGSGTGMGFGASDRPEATGNEIPWAGWRVVSNDYFKSMGVPLIAGRDFTEHDRLGAPPYRVIISERIAKLLWPGENAIGRPIQLWKGQTSTPGEVIGVVGDMRDWGLTDAPSYSVYLPTYGYTMSPANYVVHSTVPTATLVPMLRSALAELDPTLPLSDVQTFEARVGDSVASQRFTMVLLASLAGVALALALAGIYGVLSYTVSQRRSEVGVRVALGASHRSVVRMIMRQGMLPVAIGLVAGVLGSMALSRYIASLLYEVTPFDWLTYLAVAGMLLATGVLACWLPARAALRVDVLSALRDE
jgi:putative ABC transport system permease protein